MMSLRPLPLANEPAVDDCQIFTRNSDRFARSFYSRIRRTREIRVSNVCSSIRANSCCFITAIFPENCIGLFEKSFLIFLVKMKHEFYRASFIKTNFRKWQIYTIIQQLYTLIHPILVGINSFRSDLPKFRRHTLFIANHVTKIFRLKWMARNNQNETLQKREKYTS